MEKYYIWKDYRHPKRTAHSTGIIISKEFQGKINFPKIKAEIIRYIKGNKDLPAVIPEIIDIVRNIPDRRYKSEVFPWGMMVLLVYK